jgi:16S rRNA G966 N2-methylase RsmD
LNRFILNTAVQDYINENLTKNHAELALKGSPFSEIPVTQLLEQIVGKNKSKHKLPTWFQTKHIYYPNKINIEQTSSEATAVYKSKLISGNSLIDITGGFGVDSYYFAKNFKTVTHCEINPELHNIAKHNFEVLGNSNINTVCSDGLDYLTNLNINYDCIYADPSRRHDVKGKVFMLSDCEPDIPKNLDVLLNCANTLLIKASPLLDLSLGLKELKHVSQIHIIAVNNEVKELLWLINKNESQSVKIVTVNIKALQTEKCEFLLDEESKAIVAYAAPFNYLYEPNAAILKSGAFKSVGSKLQLKKLHQHSHLYTSTELIEFPGRVFKINMVVPFSKSAVSSLNISKANITTRNFPMEVKSIRKQFKITDGGDVYLFFSTAQNNEKVVIICDKLD